MRRRALLLVPLTLLASCGSDGPPAQQVVSLAPQATVDAATARIRTVLAFAGATGARLEIDGAVDFAHDRYAMAMHLLGGADATAEARLDGTALYVRVPGDGLLAGVAEGDWLRLDLRGAGGPPGVLGLDSNDPREALALLEGATDGGVRRTGEDELDGVHVTRYRAEVDVARARSGSGAGLAPELLRRFVDRLGVDTLPITAWIDDDGLVRRVRVPLPALTITTDYRDFGASVDVAPPTDQVVDVTDRLDELFPGRG
jgi:hypothetical protein